MRTRGSPCGACDARVVLGSIRVSPTLGSSPSPDSFLVDHTLVFLYHGMTSAQRPHNAHDILRVLLYDFCANFATLAPPTGTNSEIFFTAPTLTLSIHYIAFG
jgi:hypothetical protein